jgi:L-histidine N-alpha-methyltransferase
MIKSIVSGHVPLKFAYAGSAAYTHDRYASTADYQQMMTSAANESGTLLSSGLQDSASGGVAEVGPGNGLRSAAFLRHLQRAGVRFSRYLALDFSSTLLEIACVRLRASFVHCQIDTSAWDIEERPSTSVEEWRAGAGPILVCLLGHTLGNLEDPARALANIATGHRPGDVLVTSVLLREPPEVRAATIATYQSETFRRAALEPLLAAGLRRADLELDLGYREDAVVGEVTLVREVCLRGNPLPGGHRFRCFLSRRFDPEEVTRLIERSGWSVRGARIDNTDHHMTVIAMRA